MTNFTIVSWTTYFFVVHYSVQVIVLANMRFYYCFTNNSTLVGK